MKSTQGMKSKKGVNLTQGIIALVVAAALVFGGTFVVNYLHGGKGVAPVAAPQARLTFADAETNYPGKAEPPSEQELGESKSHDFWFRNDNAAPLPVGVFSKTCQCTHVELWVAPADWKTIPAPDDREKSVKELEGLTQPTELMDRETNPPSVPAGAVGVLRLRWKGDRPGPKDLAAVLWMGEKGLGPQQRFLIRTVFIGPMRVTPGEFDIGSLQQEKLTFKTSIPCWSSTRKEFPLDVEVVQNRLTNESNPFTVGKPVPFKPEDFARMRKDPRNGDVLSGYMVPIELLKVSRDKTTPFDLGLFRQRIELKMDEDHKAQVVVTGMIEGDLRIVGADAVNPVHFPAFDRTTEASQPVVVESGADVASLTLDEHRTPAFLGVEFPAKAEVNGDRKVWQLRVKWKPESDAEGVFPRDAEGYRDSAIYIKPVYAQPGAAAPALRIPVNGKADAAQ